MNVVYFVRQSYPGSDDTAGCGVVAWPTQLSCVLKSADPALYRLTVDGFSSHSVRLMIRTMTGP